ncbi:MAG: hypothetical protein LRY57_00450 [Alphaproteobacteria bacterium]|nr:hypothetical protein [Alphaproteobacteria bacterium]
MSQEIENHDLSEGIDQEGIMTAEDMMVIRAHEEDRRNGNKRRKARSGWVRAAFHVAAAVPVTLAAMALSYVATGDYYTTGAVTTGLAYPFASAAADYLGKNFGYVEGRIENMVRNRNYLQAFRQQYFAGWGHGLATAAFVMAPSTFQRQIDALHTSVNSVLPALGLQ